MMTAVKIGSLLMVVTFAFACGYIVGVRGRSYADGIARGRYEAFSTAAMVLSGRCDKTYVDWFTQQASRP